MSAAPYTANESDLARFRATGRWAADALRHARQGLAACEDAVQLAALIKRHIRCMMPAQPRWLSVGIGVNERYLNHVWYSPAPFRAGDLVTIEVGLDVAGYYTETAETVAWGTPSRCDRELIEAAGAALAAGIRAAMAGSRVRNISSAIESAVVDRGFRVSMFGAGHAIRVDSAAMDNRSAPLIPNSVAIRPRPNHGNRWSGEDLETSWGTRLDPGMCLALEPLVNGGTAEVQQGLESVELTEIGGRLHLPFRQTADGAKTAKFAHTVYLLADRTAVLTAGDDDAAG
jgi:methionyl aminopeptidase